MIRKILILTLIALILAACGGPGTTSPVSTTEELNESTGAANQAVLSTNTPLPPSEGPAEGPTMTPTPEADPRNELGNPTWRAAFGKDTEQTWFQFDDEQAKVEMKPDELVLTAYNANSSDVWSMSYPVLTNFYLEITASTGDACNGKDRYGPIVRAPDCESVSSLTFTQGSLNPPALCDFPLCLLVQVCVFNCHRGIIG